MKFVYLVWGLLPGALVFMAIRGWFRKISKRPGREHIGYYLHQALYASIFLAIAIVIDSRFFEIWVKALGFQHMDLRVVGWLIYPVILMVVASIHQHFLSKRVAREEAERKKRKVEYMFR